MLDGLRQWWHGRYHKQEYEKKWPDLPIHQLVYWRDHPGEHDFIIFIDYECDLDWRTNESVGSVTDDDESHTAKILNEVALLETRLISWPRDLKISIKRMLGEALARAFQGDHTRALEVLSHTEKRIAEKSLEVSRYWTLQAGFLALAVAGVGLVVGIRLMPAIVGMIGPTSHLLSLCFCCGAAGAFLSLVMRLGKVRVDASAERRLHSAEAYARIIAGGIAGVLVGAMVKLGIVLPVFSQAGMTALAACTAAMVGGASERLVPSIIAKIETEQTHLKGDPDDDDSTSTTDLECR